jgi:diguanylate cyclase (GGDEF)-like protein
VWQEQLRTVDHLARYGGEEFVVLLPDATIEQAREIVDRKRLATPLGQTFSAGVAGWNGTETSEELTARADAALTWPRTPDATRSLRRNRRPSLPDYRTHRIDSR